MGTLNGLNLAQLSTVDLKTVCESLGLSFNVIGECEQLEVTGNMAALDGIIRDAIKAQREDLMALVWLVDKHGEQYSDVPTGAWRELDKLIIEFSERSQYTHAQYEALYRDTYAMAACHIPHCIDYFKMRLERLDNGGQMQHGH